MEVICRLGRVTVRVAWVKVEAIMYNLVMVMVMVMVMDMVSLWF